MNKDDYKEVFERMKAPLPPPLSEIDEGVQGWLGLAGITLVMTALLKIPLTFLFPQWFGFAWNYLIFQVCLGVLLLTRVGWVRVLTLIYTFTMGVGTPWAALFLYQDLAPKMIAIGYGVYCLLIFIFLLLPKVRQAFSPLFPFQDTRGVEAMVLTEGERRQTRFWIMVIALVMLAESLLEAKFEEQLRSLEIFPAYGKFGLLLAYPLLDCFFCGSSGEYLLYAFVLLYGEDH